MLRAVRISLRAVVATSVGASRSVSSSTNNFLWMPNICSCTLRTSFIKGNLDCLTPFGLVTAAALR